MTAHAVKRDPRYVNERVAFLAHVTRALQDDALTLADRRELGRIAARLGAMARGEELLGVLRFEAD